MPEPGKTPTRPYEVFEDMTLAAAVTARLPSDVDPETWSVAALLELMAEDPGDVLVPLVTVDARNSAHALRQAGGHLDATAPCAAIAAKYIHREPVNVTMDRKVSVG